MGKGEGDGRTGADEGGNVAVGGDLAQWDLADGGVDCVEEGGGFVGAGHGSARIEVSEKGSDFAAAVGGRRLSPAAWAWKHQERVVRVEGVYVLMYVCV